MRRAYGSCYGRLGDHLAARAAAGETRATLTFAAIEALVGRPLPPSARHSRGYRPWWLGSAAFGPAWDG